MNDPDPLAVIKARWSGDELHRAEWWADHAGRDVPRLFAEVERLRDLLAQRDTLLARLEWAAQCSPGSVPTCPACRADAGWGHETGCELAAALHPDPEQAP